MAKISTYPSADTPLLLSDRLIGTEAPRLPPSPTPLATKNFSLSELLNLFSSNFPAASLQAVLDTGNTATQNIYLTGNIESTVIKPINIEDPTGSQGTTFQYLSKGTSSISWVNLPVDNLQAVLNSGNSATQNMTLVGNITSTLMTPGNIKDETSNLGSVGQVLTKTSTGIVWADSSTPFAASLADVLFTGNTATNDINLTGDMYATTFVKSGGTSSQFLKADGSVDSSVYALASSLPTVTSDLINDGDDGINPFISLADVPAQVNSDWNSTSGVSEILNKPTIPTATSDLTNDGADGINPFITLADVPVPTNGLPAGGTVGQILTKVDSVDYNATWQENFADWTSVVKHTVKNNGLSGTITKGTAVYVTGSNGTNMLVGRASNISEATSSKTMGLMQSDITTTGVNQTGFVITEGLLQGLNTAGQTAGDPVWLGVNGALIYGLINKPYAPAHLVFIGIVTKISAGNGEIFVKVQNGFELKEIHDVDIITTTPVNGQVLGFDGTLWVNKTVAGWLGFTAENTANKQNSLATDGTGVKFPTVDAVNSLSMIDRGKRMASFFFDFMNGSEPYITSNSVSGSITIPTQTTVPNLTSNQLGIIQYSTNLVATSYTYHFSQFTNHLWFGGGICNFETSVEMANLSTALERFRTLHGFASATNSQSEANGAFFTYDEGGVVNGTVASANWQCVTVNNNTRTLTTTTIPVTTTWTKLRVEVNAAGTSVAFYVNGTLAATHTTNIPLFSQSRFVFVKQGMAKVIGITARVMYCDYFGYETISTTPRT